MSNDNAMSIKYVMVQKNPWMEFDVCRECEWTDDAYQGKHTRVCPRCGSRNICVKIGRWLTYHPRLTFFQWLCGPFLVNHESFRLVAEFKTGDGA